jgi:formate--tetrahydrofolate ligase
VVVAVNRFAADTPAEFAVIAAQCEGIGVRAIACNHWAAGGAGAAELAEIVTQLTSEPRDFRLLYADDLPLEQKIRAVAREIYRAGDVTFDAAAAAQLRGFAAAGFGHLPVCMAKTQYSFSSDPALKGAPEHFTLNIREARLSAGAGFVVALCGEILTMPGLPRHAAAEDVFLDAAGRIGGLS